MKFFETYFTLHHLRHSPLKWFLATIIYPIHLAEKHYKKVYHLNYVHAKKLFIFDLCLLISIFFIGFTTIFWWTYDPTITDLVYINIEQPNTKIKSGDYITYKISYKNESTVKMEDSILKIELPQGFMLDKTLPENFDKKTNEFSLLDIKAGECGSVMISGWFYGTPDEHHFIHAKLVYKQEDKSRIEEKYIPLITIPRGSVLQTEIIANNNILDYGSTPIKLKIKNDGELILNNIEINLENENFSVIYGEPTIKISELKPQTEQLFSVILKLKNSFESKQINYSITPSLEINQTVIKQNTISHNFVILHPDLILTSNWQNNINSVSPAENLKLNLNLKNSGDTDLKNLEINIPIDTTLIDSNKIKDLNSIATYNNKNLKINTINKLVQNEEKNIEIILPILTYPQGTDIKLVLTPVIKSEVENSLDIFEIDSQTSEVKIGTNIIFSQSLKYYTNEGDQIGRGPNPPEINKESKYWVFLEIENGSSRIKNLILDTNLSANISFTGKTSVSKGNNIIFNEKNNNIHWETTTLNPHEKVGVYFEVAFTPKNIEETKNLLILKNTSLIATDTFIEKEIKKVNENLILKN